MRLVQALGIAKGQVVSFVGAGGKTTLMYRLAAELAELGWRVLTTTTTHIRPPKPGQSERLIVEPDQKRSVRAVREALRRCHLVTLASRWLEQEDKLVGIPPDWVPALLGVADAVIVEADGARERSIKAPAAHEPVVPAETAALVAVIGMDCVGLPLSAAVAHRPEIVARLSGTQLGDTITPEVVSRVLTHSDGGMRGLPEGSGYLPVLNKVHDATRLALAREIAQKVRSNATVRRVLITEAVSPKPVLECWRRVSAVVLAAGASVRYGAPKQLLPVGPMTMIEHVIEELRSSWVDEIVVVVGHEAEQIARLVPADCRVAVNHDWATGISSSIGTGLRQVDVRSEAVIFVLADQPGLDSRTVNRIMLAFYSTDKSIVVPVSGGVRGTPVLFEHRRFGDLTTLQGDVGGRSILASLPSEVEVVELDSPSVFMDIDTREDYERYRSAHGPDR